MKRTVSFLLAAMLLLSLCACGGRTTAAPETPTPETSPVSGQTAVPTPTEAAVNNGGLYVGLNGDVYYRQYDASDVETSGMFGNFAAVSGSEKQMMVRHADGSTEALFTDTGVGPIVLLNDAFYLQTSEYVGGKVYRVDMTGENRTELLDGCILAVDEQNDRLICQRGTDIVSLDPAIGEPRVLATHVTYAGLADGRVYYSSSFSGSDDARRGALVFQSVATDGTDVRTLAQTQPDLYDYPSDTDATVVCMQAVDDVVYFNYGAYAGTAHAFQGGSIMRVGLDGSGLTKIVDAAQEDFYVSSRGGTDYLYYVPGELGEPGTGEGAICRNVATGAEETAAFAAPIGVPYVDSRTADGSIYSDETGTPTKLFTSKDLAGYDRDYGYGEETLYLVDQVNVVGDLVFFRILRGTHDAANDVGWRYSYTFASAEIYCRDLTTGQVTQVFAY